MRRSSLLLLPLLVSGCGSPSRDNGYDPANAPVAVLKFFDATRENGACDATLGTAGSIIVLERGRCLGLSALDSTDPQEGVPTSFRFARLDGDTEVPLTALSATAAVFVTGQAIRDLDQEVLRFRLTVADSGGTEISTDREIPITNDTPVAPHVSSMTIPFGGYPWAPSTLDVRFESSSGADPNGDTIASYVWSFPDGTTESSVDPLSPLFTRPLDVNDYRPYAAQFRIEDDGGLSSETRTMVVNRRPANVWVQSNDGFARTDALRRSITFSGLSGSLYSRYFEPVGMSPRTAVVYESTGSRVAAVLAWPDLNVPNGTSVPLSNQSGFALSPAGDQLVIVDTTGTTGTVRRLGYDGTTLGAPSSTAITMPIEGIGLAPAVEHTLGAIWVSRRHESLYAIDPAAGSLLQTFTDVLGFQGFGVRPGTGELWMARSVNTSEVPFETARLHRFTSVASPQVIETYEPRIRWLTWADADELWVVLDRETVLLDANVLAAGGTFETAVITRATTSEDAIYAATDLSNGDVVVVSLSQAPIRVRRDGSTRPLPISTQQFFLEYSDRQGGFWSTSASSLERTSPDGGLTAETPFFAEGGGGPDGQGGIWAAGGSLFGMNATLVHIAEDGTIVRRHDTFMVDGVETPLPNVALFRTEPGTSIAWAQFGQFGASKGVYRIDLSKAPPVGTLVIGTAQSAQLVHPIMEPSSPLAAVPFTWMIGPNYTMWQVQNDGQVTPSASAMFPGTFENYRGARSVVSNGLCLGSSRNSGTGFFRGRWFPGNSPPNEQLLAGISVPFGTFVGPTAVSRQNDGTGDVCWYSYQEPNSGTCAFGAARIIPHIAGVASPLFTYTVSPAGAIKGLYPINPDRFMLVVTRCTATGEQVREIELITRQVTGAFARTTVKSGVSADAFLDWETSAEDSFLLP